MHKHLYLDTNICQHTNKQEKKGRAHAFRIRVVFAEYFTLTYTILHPVPQNIMILIHGTKSYWNAKTKRTISSHRYETTNKLL